MLVEVASRRAARPARGRATIRTSRPIETVGEAARLLARDHRPGVRHHRRPSSRRGRGTAARSGRSSPPMTRRCVTAARPTRAVSPATNCMPRPRAKTPLLTAIAISPGNEHDGHHAATLVGQQPARRRPTRVIGDTAYGNVEVREQLEQRAIGVLAPLHLKARQQREHRPQGQFRDRPRPRLSPAHRARRRRSISPGPAGRRRRNPHRALCRDRLRALPAARTLRSQRPAQGPHPPPRGPAPKRATRTRRSRPARATSSASDHASSGSSD